MNNCDEAIEREQRLRGRGSQEEEELARVYVGGSSKN